VQGCDKRCPGCMAPDWQERRANRLWIPWEFAEVHRKESFVGITLSGGEPFLQPLQLARFIDAMRAERDLDVICFTGMPFYELISNEHRMLLSRLDVLIDGDYQLDKITASGLRGSTNQHILHLTERLVNADLETYPRKVVVQDVGDGLLLTGIPTPKLSNNLEIILDALKPKRSK